MRFLSSLRLLVLFACAALALAACRRDAPVADAADPLVARFVTVADTSVRYVGDATCATCHADLAASYKTHAMARGFHRPETDSVPEAYPSPAITHAASGFTYRAFREGDRFFQEETRADDPGHRLVREVTYVIGSGNAARTYLSESNGRLYELPLTWYNQRGVWDFSPGYEIGNQRFTRTVPERCIACHNAYPKVEPFTANKFTELGTGISCERCHGPGSLHAAARQAGEAVPDSIDYTIVNPKHLPIGRRLDVCQQCHLHGGIELLREGREANSFRPGEALDAHLALFALDAPETEGRIPVSSQAERMQRSACFKAGQMDCTTCHNPHSGAQENNREAFNQTCQSCHALPALQAKVSAAQKPNHTATGACVTCHMPHTEAVDAPHSSFTDHWIRVVREQPTPPADSTSGAVVLKPWFAKDREGTPGRVYEGIAYLVYGQQNGRRDAMEEGVRRLQTVLAETEGFGEARFLLGFALLRLARPTEAVPHLEAAVQAAPVPERLNTLAQAYEQTGRPPAEAQRLYTQAIAQQPALASIRVNLGRLLQSQGDLAGAAEQYARAAEEQPWLAEAQYNLGSLFLQQGNAAAGQQALEAAVQLDPGNPQGRGNLGTLYAQAGQTAKARQQFEAAVRVAPQDPVALGNLGALLLNTGDAARARPLLERAVAANPAYVDGAVNLALACGQTGDLACAQAQIGRVAQIAPNDPRLPQLQAALAGATGAR